MRIQYLYNALVPYRLVTFITNKRKNLQKVLIPFEGALKRVPLRGGLNGVHPCRVVEIPFLFFRKILAKVLPQTAGGKLSILVLCLILSGCGLEDKPKGLQLGDIAPDFAVKDINDQVIVLSNLRGKPVILRFFETNCRFCKADTPTFKDFYDKHRGKGLQVIYIGSFFEKKDDLRTFAGELQINFPVAMDAGAKLADLYDIRAYPQTLFISPDQKILAALLGGVGQAELVEILGKYLQ